MMLNEFWIPVTVLLVLGLLWMALAFWSQMSREDIALGHSEWPEDLTDFNRIVVKIDLPVPDITKCIYSQVVMKYGFDPLGA